MIRLALCDDHALVRAGLVQILATRKDFQIVGEAADGPALITLLRGQAVDVALLDIALPGRDGLEVLQQMRLEWPLLPVPEMVPLRQLPLPQRVLLFPRSGRWKKPFLLRGPLSSLRLFHRSRQ